MEDAFTITLPQGVSSAEMEALQLELRDIDGVSDYGSMDALGVAPQEIMLWVQLAAGVIGAATAAVPLFEKLQGLFRKRGIRGAQVTLADGTIISFDDVDADELKVLLDAARSGA